MSTLARKLLGVPRPSVLYGSAAQSVTNLATYTFASQTFNTADSSRVVVVYISSDRVSGSPTINSVTIGGVTGILGINSGDATYRTAFYYAVVPTGTTGDIVVTHSAVMDVCSVACWSLYNVNPTPKLTGLKSTATAFPSISFAGDDIGLFADYPGAASNTWTNATESFDVASYNTGAYYQASYLESRTVSNSYSGAVYAAYGVWGT